MPKRRANRVCSSCHKKKIRCDLDTVSIPCSKCSELGETCVIRARKAYSHRVVGQVQGSTTPAGASDHRWASSDPGVVEVQNQVVAVVVANPSSKSQPIFSGTGGYNAILHSIGESTWQHFDVPMEVEATLSSEDLAYLRHKGCFSVPTESDALLQAYFQFIHPTFPVLDGPSFSQQYARGGIGSLNLLLLWSLFSAAASFISNYAHRDVKRSFVQRAKLLFDLTHENDKAVLIQSSLLLSFWFAEAEDIKQSWYWTSIAFGLAQSLGLHRGLPGSSAQDQSLWKNLWRCCLIRDAWLAFGMGRSLRLSTTDVDTTLSSATDAHLRNVVFHGQQCYSPAEMTRFTDIFEQLMATTSTLRQYLAGDHGFISKWTQSLEDQFESENKFEKPLHLEIAQLQLQLHQYALIITLYRDQGKEVETRARTQEMLTVITTLMSNQDYSFVSATIIPLMVPPAVTYLLSLRSPTPEQRQHSNHALDLIGQFLCRIEENYPAATIVKRLLDAARHATSEDGSGRMILGDSSDIMMEHLFGYNA